MKVVYEPVVYMVSRPQIDWMGVGALLANESGGGDWEREEETTEGEALCELMGRLCYRSFGPRQGRKSTREYIANIMKQGHGSVLEHANYGFVVARCSRGYTHQAVRHRAGFAYSQESTHFIKYGDDATVCLPALSCLPEADRILLENSLKNALVAYDLLFQHVQESGVLATHLPEAAKTKRKKLLCGSLRGALPIALESKLGFTANLRALRHMVEMRGGEENTVEIRMVAAQVMAYMRTEAPTVFSDMEVRVGEDGHVVVRCERRKV